ncbi:hypothetical protein G6F22_009465 [Rhizopus arrhizus]|nr:hypothetical protein G6F23_009026 [Rhizopus arrhizus]KAG0781667.1 hypothetical protein G6F22_009465 [Rhizopus arrhizus]
MKAKGLQKLKFYCQACEKQCRDENGFKCHMMSESHQRQMLLVAQNPGKHISNFTEEFKSNFIRLLSRGHGTKRVLANRVYMDYIAQRDHIHMNATKWNSLSEFCKEMGRAGIFRVDETERGLHIAWVDNSPKALARQAAILKMERATKDDEEREKELLQEQVDKATKIAEEKGLGEQKATELKREGEQPIKLNLFSKPMGSTTATTQSSSSSSKPNGTKMMFGGFKKRKVIYTKMGRKTFEKSEGSFKVTPLLPRKEQENNSTEQNKKNYNNKRNGKKENNRSSGFKRNRDDNEGNNSNKRKKEVCFACRQPGHSVNRCPRNKEHAKICYNCGSTEHSLKECRKPKKGNKLPYAKCFICNEEGHLSGKCPKNERGLYPNGGSCAICQQVDHFAKDCPVTKEQAGTTAVGLISLDQGADDDDYHIFVEEKQKVTDDAKKVKKQEAVVAKQPIKKKVVKF